MERSVFSDKNTFALNCYENNLLNKIEWQIYNEWFDWLSKDLDLDGDGYIYLRTSPEVAYQRLQKRCRKEEINIPL